MFGYVLIWWCWGVFQESVLLVGVFVLRVSKCVVTLASCPNIRALCSQLCELLAHMEEALVHGVDQILGFDSGLPQVPAIPNRPQSKQHCVTCTYVQLPLQFKKNSPSEAEPGCSPSLGCGALVDWLNSIAPASVACPVRLVPVRGKAVAAPSRWKRVEEAKSQHDTCLGDRKSVV